MKKEYFNFYKKNVRVILINNTIIEGMFVEDFEYEHEILVGGIAIKYNEIKEMNLID